MKKITLIILVFLALISCEKIPERTPTQLNLISINNSPVTDYVINDLDYTLNYDFVFTYQSDAKLSDVRIRLTDKNTSDIEGIDETRLSKTVFNDSIGTFTYSLNPSEQCQAPSNVGLTKYYFIKLIMLNESGIVIEKQVQFDFE
jgi:hypothetical protein